MWKREWMCRPGRAIVCFVGLPSAVPTNGLNSGPGGRRLRILPRGEVARAYLEDAIGEFLHIDAFVAFGVEMGQQHVELGRIQGYAKVDQKFTKEVRWDFALFVRVRYAKAVERVHGAVRLVRHARRQLLANFAQTVLQFNVVRLEFFAHSIP